MGALPQASPGDPIKIIDRAANVYEAPNTPLGIVLNTTTYTKVLDSNPDRLGITYSNLSQNTILIREKADIDDLDRGFAVWGRTTYRTMSDNVPTGEIWAKALNGTPSLLVSEM